MIHPRCLKTTAARLDDCQRPAPAGAGIAGRASKRGPPLVEWPRSPRTLARDDLGLLPSGSFCRGPSVDFGKARRLSVLFTPRQAKVEPPRGDGGGSCASPLILALYPQPNFAVRRRCGQEGPNACRSTGIRVGRRRAPSPLQRSPPPIGRASPMAQRADDVLEPTLWPCPWMIGGDPRFNAGFLDARGLRPKPPWVMIQNCGRGHCARSALYERHCEVCQDATRGPGLAKPSFDSHGKSAVIREGPNGPRDRRILDPLPGLRPILKRATAEATLR